VSQPSEKSAFDRPHIVCVIADDGKVADGVRDHANRLAEHLRDHDIDADVVAIPWAGNTFASRLRALRDSIRGAPDCVVLHYSHLAWSRLGLPFGFLALVAWFRLRGPVTLWLHDPGLVGQHRLRYRAGSALKGCGLHLAVRVAGTGVVTVNPVALSWVTSSLANRVVLCPSPSNVGGKNRVPPVDLYTVACFGQGIGNARHEREPLTRVAEALVDRIGPFRLRLLGASDEAPASLLADLGRLGVTCDVPGFLPPDDLRDRLAASHAFLMVRSGLTTRSGTLGAALACGLPVVGMRGPETAPPLTDAGVIAMADGDWQAMADALTTLARDRALQEELSRRSQAVAREHYSWDVVCARLLRLVGVASKA